MFEIVVYWILLFLASVMFILFYTMNFLAEFWSVALIPFLVSALFSVYTHNRRYLFYGLMVSIVVALLGGSYWFFVLIPQESSIIWK